MCCMTGFIAPNGSVSPKDLIGSGGAAALLQVDKSTLSRRISSGKIKPLARLDGPHGPFVFDRSEIEQLVKESTK